MVGSAPASVRHRSPALRRFLRGGLRAVGRLALLAACSPISLADATSLEPVAPPALVVEAPPELAAAASTVRAVPAARFATAMRLTGLAAPGPPITVVLAPEGSPAARSAPAWISGWAFGERGVIVLLPGRVQRYPDDDLAALLQHEVTHVLIARAAAGAEVPRWLDEGLAMAASRNRDLEDRGRVAWSVLVHGPGSLSRLDAAFAGGESEMQAAYAFAQDFVQELLRRGGSRAMPDLFARLARGTAFPTAFREAMHVDLADAESDYWDRRTFWMRWVPVLSSSTLLWIAISALAVVAIQRRRARDAERMRRWEQEERLLDSAGLENGDDEIVN